MRWAGLLLAVAVLLAEEATAAKPPEGICTHSDDITQCTCNDDVTELTLNEGDLINREVREKFVVQKCRKLQLNTNVFKGMRNLRTLFIDNVSEVYLEPDAFEQLEELQVKNVNYLKLTPSSLQGSRGVTRINIKNTTIPELPEQSISNIQGFADCTLQTVHIHKIKNNSIIMQMSTDTEKRDIILQNCTIAEIEEGAIVINSTVNLLMGQCIVNKAARNSVRMDQQVHVYMTNNIFRKDVEVDAFLISGKNILFKNNQIEALTLNTFKQIGSKQSSSFHGLDEIFVHGTDNKMPCECPMEEVKTNWSRSYFSNNFCMHGCRAASVYAFLESCSLNRSLNSQTRIKNLCDKRGYAKPPSTSTEEDSHLPHEVSSSTDNPSTSNASINKGISNAVRKQLTAELFVFIATVILLN